MKNKIRKNKNVLSDYVYIWICLIVAVSMTCSHESNHLENNIGVCTSLKNSEILSQNGYSYIEEGVRRFLIPEESGEKFNEKLEQSKKSPVPVYACNGFIPGSLKSVGHEARHEDILKYAETAFRRANLSGVKTIVFGSGASRKIPEGFDKNEAKEQFISLLKRMSPIAGKYGVVISLEPLNKGETNFINNLAEGLEIVKSVNHPNFRLLADFYHMLKENETPEEIVKAGEYLYHCHIAEKEKRTPPGIAGDDFKPYFEALKKINYKGKISIECRWQDMKEELPAAIVYLKNQIKGID